MSRAKLTPAQLTFLRKLEAGPQHCVYTYKPADKLFELKLATRRLVGQYGQMAYTITNLGHDWLATHEGRK